MFNAVACPPAAAAAARQLAESMLASMSPDKENLQHCAPSFDVTSTGIAKCDGLSPRSEALPLGGQPRNFSNKHLRTKAPLKSSGCVIATPLGSRPRPKALVIPVDAADTGAGVPVAQHTINEAALIPTRRRRLLSGTVLPGRNAERHALMARAPLLTTLAEQTEPPSTQRPSMPSKFPIVVATGLALASPLQRRGRAQVGEHEGELQLECAAWRGSVWAVLASGQLLYYQNASEATPIRKHRRKDVH
eukprot:SAG11_NODE_3848_length_2192_cov_1.253703_1_plen_248_part_00